MVRIPEVVVEKSRGETAATILARKSPGRKSLQPESSLQSAWSEGEETETTRTDSADTGTVHRQVSFNGIHSV